MSILVDRDTRLIVQGITGREGEYHARLMQDYGTRIVAGVTPGKGGRQVEGIPVFDTVADAVAATDANASVLFVRPGSPETRSWKPWTADCLWSLRSPKACLFRI